MQLAMFQNRYDVEETITVSQATLTTDKSATLVDALDATNTALIHPPNGTVALELRIRGLMSDGDDNVLNLYGMRGHDDHYSLMVTLSIKTGTQLYSSGNRFVDTVVKTNEKWWDSIDVISDAADGIARVAFNTHGYSDFALIATTLNSSSVIVEASQV